MRELLGVGRLALEGSRPADSLTVWAWRGGSLLFPDPLQVVDWAVEAEGPAFGQDLGYFAQHLHLGQKFLRHGHVQVDEFIFRQVQVAFEFDLVIVELERHLVLDVSFFDDDLADFFEQFVAA